MSARAGQWLARMLPKGLLHKHPAERAIHDLVVRLLTRSGDDDDGRMAAAMARGSSRTAGAAEVGVR